MITLLAAVISTIIWYVNAPESKLKLGTLSLMYWGASLMWIVDGFFCIAGGEPFLDISVNDALLGLLIVICGLAAWLMILLYSDPKKVFRTFQFKN
jgi:hypothetical protein